MKKAVSLRNKGESGRILEIEIDRKKVSTPGRVVNHVEKNLVDEFFTEYSTGLSTKELPPCEIQETVVDFNNEGVRRLLNKNGELIRRARFISSANRNRQSRLKISNIRITEGTEWNKDAIELLTLAQLNSSCLNLISVPDPIYNDSTTFNLFDAYSKARDTLDERGLTQARIMPNLDLRTEPMDLEIQIKELIDIGVESIAFRFRPKAFASALRVSKLLSNEDIWVHLSGVRKSMIDGTVPAIHIQPLYSFDSISAFKYYPPQTRKTETDDGRLAIASSERRSPDTLFDNLRIVEIRTPTSRKFTRFDASVLGIFDKQQHTDFLGSDLNCDCFLCKGENADSFFNYRMKDGKISWQKYRNHHTLHELWASQNEFINSRQVIIESGYNDYLLQKPNIVAHEDSIDGLVPQSNLLDFI